MESAGFGALIRARREELGMTQAELADRIGSPREYISQIELGTKKWPRKYVRSLSEVLNIPFSELERAAGRTSKPLRPSHLPPAGFQPNTATKERRGDLRPQITIIVSEPRDPDSSQRHLQLSSDQFQELVKTGVGVFGEVISSLLRAEEQDFVELMGIHRALEADPPPDSNELLQQLSQVVGTIDAPAIMQALLFEPSSLTKTEVAQLLALTLISRILEKERGEEGGISWFHSAIARVPVPDSFLAGRDEDVEVTT